MSNEEPQPTDGPDLANYSGTGDDLTDDQKQYLNSYALQDTDEGSPQAETAAVSLSDDAEGEWA